MGIQGCLLVLLSSYGGEGGGRGLGRITHTSLSYMQATYHTYLRVLSKTSHSGSLDAKLDYQSQPASLPDPGFASQLLKIENRVTLGENSFNE